MHQIRIHKTDNCIGSLRLTGKCIAKPIFNIFGKTETSSNCEDNCWNGNDRQDCRICECCSRFEYTFCRKESHCQQQLFQSTHCKAIRWRHFGRFQPPDIYLDKLYDVLNFLAHRFCLQRITVFPVSIWQANRKNESSVSVSRVLFPDVFSGIRVPAIYLICESPHSSSVLPSIALIGTSGQPVYDGLRELAASSGHNQMITHLLVVSYTAFSPLPFIGMAVVFFCLNLLLPIASIFGSGAPDAARTFLPHRKTVPVTAPKHCFQYAKIVNFIDNR